MFIRGLFLTILALIAWTALAVVGTVEGWWRKPLAPFGDMERFRAAAVAEIDSKHRGNAVFVLLSGGKPIATHFVSRGKPVDGDSRFQVASLSKWITAWGVMTLVEAGKIDLDRPVSTYLKRWTLPPSQFDAREVTVRRVLSHTAGLTDGLGYAGFAPGEAVQDLAGSLTRAADASPGADGAVRVGLKPGNTFKYSGGGYTMLQMMIEDVSGMSFNAYMTSHVFDPLGMTRSTFVPEETSSPDVAEFFDSRGAPATHFRFSALAAASLYTTANDMTRFLQAHVAGSQGELPGRGVLRPQTLADMRQPHALQYGVEIWGLGTMLYAPNNGGGYVIGHDGNNEPAINTAARIDPSTGDGIIILETGNPLLATTLASEWVFWRTGSIDFLMFFFEMDRLVTLLIGGWVLIALVALVLLWLGFRRRAA